MYFTGPYVGGGLLKVVSFNWYVLLMAIHCLNSMYYTWRQKSCMWETDALLHSKFSVSKSRECPVSRMIEFEFNSLRHSLNWIWTLGV